jgi:hypothetical protein
MLELSKSFCSLSWAASVFGAQQLTELLSAGGATKANASAYSVTTAIQEQFGANPVFFALDQIGDKAQREAVDFFWDLLRLKPLNPRWLGHTGGQLFRRSVDLASALTPGENLEASLQELRNTFTVVKLVNQAPATLSLPPGPVQLMEAADRAYSLGGNYGALWLVEGLGKEYADRNWLTVTPIRGLLNSGESAQLTPNSLLMMHAGMGISFANRTVSHLTPYTSDSEVFAALQAFVSLVVNNSRPGYEGPAYESLGLVTRTWYPQMVPVIDRNLWNINLDVLEYFWHGVGRASYFSAENMIPGASAFRGVASEAPHQLAMLNGKAGIAWAFTLVNIRQPAILLHLLKNEGAELSADGSFTNGVISTSMMALDTLPGDPNVLALCRYSPETSDPELAARWDRMVHSPCQRAIERYYPLLKNNGQLGEIFRYRDLEELATTLEGRS